MNDDGGRIGLVDGSVECDSRTFQVVLDPDVVIQLDELLAVTTDLPDGRQVTHYGIGWAASANTADAPFERNREERTA